MVRIGLIGCGDHSEIGHALPLARYKAEHPSDVDLAAVCDIREERRNYFCSKYGFRSAHANIDSLLNSGSLDLIIAVVPVEKIAEVGIKLLRHGTPCVVEKPLGASLSEITALRDAARATRTANMVSVNRRFMPLLRKALAWTRELGDLRYIRATMTRHARTEPEFLWQTAVHAVDALRFIAGEVRSSSIRTMPGIKDTPCWYGIDLSFENGVQGRIDVLPTAGMLEESYELIGEEFRAIVTAPFGPERGLRSYRENQLVLNESTNGTPEDIIFGFYEEATETIQSLLKGRSLSPSIEDVSPSVELCMRLFEESQSARQS